MNFNEDIFVVDCWPDNEAKEKSLISLINRLKSYNIPILLTGHYPVKPEIQGMVDYYLFDKNNPILLNKDFEEYGVVSTRWSEMQTFRIENDYAFHHDYAIWETMRNAFNFCKYLGKKNIHFLEYDNLPDEFQYRQAFLERINNFDAILYEYMHDGTYCSTYIFSIKTDIALKVIDQVKDKVEFFTNRPNGWQLEKVFLSCLKNVTNNFHITEYIANDNELNTHAVWNRDGMFRGGIYLQIYLAVDENENIYLHAISGFSDKKANKDYLLELNYGNLAKFHNLTIGEYYTEKLGKYKQGDIVSVYYQGVEVFSERLSEPVHDFRKSHRYISKEPKQKLERKINVNFVDGASVEILEDENHLYDIQFINAKTGQIEFSTELKSNHWCKASIKYYIDWIVKIKGIDFEFQYQHIFNAKNKNVFICYETKSLGDNIAFMPYVEEFRKTHKCKVYCSTFHNKLFMGQYPEIEFVEPGVSVNNIYALYRLGMFYKTSENGLREINYDNHPTDPKKVSLLQMASDILGLEYKEIRTKLPKLGTKKEKRVCLGIHSTAQAKYWNNPNGWQDVTDYLIGQGYEVMALSKEEDGYMGNFYPKGVTKLPAGSLLDVIKIMQESELFIGISSGLSWLSWGADVPTMIISGFTDEFTEPTQGVTRIINKTVCNSCWSNFDFDAGDWNWCPMFKNTPNQFECSKSITSESVITQINSILFKK